MTKKSNAITVDVPPKNLDDHIFYGMKLDKYQKEYRDAIWDESKRIVFCNAIAGAGKTTIAVATSVMLHRYGLYDNIIYVMHSVGDAQGFLPGTISEKSSVWFEGLYQALIVSGVQPHVVVNNECMANQKNGTGFVTAITDSYLRGSNIGACGRSILIIDEAQNYDEFSLRKTLTRACKDTKVIVIGHVGQIDLPHNKRSGFEPCMNHFKNKNENWMAFCELRNNYRGPISQIADECWNDKKL